MNKRALRIAVWGLGPHAVKNIIPAILQSSDFVLIGIYTRNKDNLLATTLKYKCICWETENSFLNDVNVDVVYLATPIALHFEQGCKVLSAGKHLLCEKSLTHDPNLSLQLVEIAKKNDRLLLETFMYLFHAQFITLKRLIRHADFGKIISIVSNFGFPKLINPGYRNNIKLGGGAFLDVGCYPISLTANLLEEWDLPVVLNTTIRPTDKYQVDGTGSALLKFHGDVMAYLNWGYNRAYKNDVTIWGEKKSVYTNFIFSKSSEKHTSIVCHNEFGQSMIIDVESQNSFSQMLSHFYESLLEGRDYVKQMTRQALLMKEVLSYGS